jgi:hypothetical protein
MLGVVMFLAGQIQSFPGWLEKVLSPSYKPRKRHWAITFLTVFFANILVWITLWLSYPVPLIVLALILAWGMGIAFVGMSPFYWLARKWEHQRQQKLLQGPERRLIAVDWDVDVS